MSFIELIIFLGIILISYLIYDRSFENLVSYLEIFFFWSLFYFVIVSSYIFLFIDNGHSLNENYFQSPTAIIKSVNEKNRKYKEEITKLSKGNLEEKIKFINENRFYSNALFVYFNSNDEHSNKTMNELASKIISNQEYTGIAFKDFSQKENEREFRLLVEDRVPAENEVILLFANRNWADMLEELEEPLYKASIQTNSDLNFLMIKELRKFKGFVKQDSEILEYLLQGENNND